MTNWKLKKSYKLEALNLLNLLNEDPYFNELYIEEKSYLLPLFTKNELENINTIYQEIKINNNQIISAVLSLYLSTVYCEDTEEIIDVLKNKLTVVNTESSTIENWNNNNWESFSSIVPNLISYFKALERINFKEYLETVIYPKTNNEILEITTELDLNPKNIVDTLSSFLNKSIDDEIIMYLVHFSRPLGIRLFGNSLVAISGMPFEISIYIAVHEMIHTPYTINSLFSKYFKELKNDSFFNKIYENRDHNLGYNTIEDYFDENATRAADHYISSKFNVFDNIDKYVSGDYRIRFKKQDGGMHILSPIIYYYLEKEYTRFVGNYQDFLEKLIREDKISPGNIEKEYNKIMNKQLDTNK